MLENQVFTAMCRYLGRRGYPRHRSAPVKISCCKQMMHYGCLYAFLANQYGYPHRTQRGEWRCPHCRTRFVTKATQHFPKTVRESSPPDRDNIRRTSPPHDLPSSCHVQSADHLYDAYVYDAAAQPHTKKHVALSCLLLCLFLFG